MFLKQTVTIPRLYRENSTNHLEAVLTFISSTQIKTFSQHNSQSPNMRETLPVRHRRAFNTKNNPIHYMGLCFFVLNARLCGKAILKLFFIRLIASIFISIMKIFYLMFMITFIKGLFDFYKKK